MSLFFFFSTIRGSLSSPHSFFHFYVHWSPPPPLPFPIPFLAPFPPCMSSFYYRSVCTFTDPPLPSRFFSSLHSEFGFNSACIKHAQFKQNWSINCAENVHSAMPRAELCREGLHDLCMISSCILPMQKMKYSAKVLLNLQWQSCGPSAYFLLNLQWRPCGPSAYTLL